MKQTIRMLAASLLLVACSRSSSSLDTSDSQNQTILSDVAVSSSSSSSRGAVASSSSSSSSQPGGCHGNPFEACKADGQTYCADSLPPEPGSEDPSQLGEASFEQRHEKMHAYITCLQTNLAKLSSSCQTVVQNAPSHPPQNRQGNEFRRGPGAGHPPHGGPGACGGRSLLAACVSDAKTICGAELPAEGEVSEFTADERHARVEAIVSCLNTQLDSVSAACQAALKQLPTL